MGVKTTGGYDRQANRVVVRTRVQIPNAKALGSCSGPLFVGLPAAVSTDAIATLSGRENGTSGKMVQGYSHGGAASAVVYAYDQSSVAVPGADIVITGTYEAAP